MYSFNRKSVSKAALAGIIATVAIIAGVAGFYFVNSGSGNGTGGLFGPCYKTITTNYVTTYTTYSTQNYNPNIVNGLVTVNANTYEDYQFTIPSSASSGTVTGSFTASGGSGNDIKVYIMDQTNFVNWQNGHSSSAYYNSGQVTTANINVNLGSGTYYLVYDNTFSIFSQKNVQTTVDFSYSTVTPVQQTAVATSTYTTTC